MSNSISDSMNIYIKNLGPIKKLNIQLGDLTLLIGPPNTGKSYTLKAIYSKLIFLDENLRSTLVRKFQEKIIEYLHNNINEDYLHSIFERESEILCRTLIKNFAFLGYALENKIYVNEELYRKFLYHYPDFLSDRNNQISLKFKNNKIFCYSNGITFNINSNLFFEALNEFLNEITQNLVPLNKNSVIKLNIPEGSIEISEIINDQLIKDTISGSNRNLDEINIIKEHTISFDLYLRRYLEGLLFKLFRKRHYFLDNLNVKLLMKIDFIGTKKFK